MAVRFAHACDGARHKPRRAVALANLRSFFFASRAASLPGGGWRSGGARHKPRRAVALANLRSFFFASRAASPPGGGWRSGGGAA